MQVYGWGYNGSGQLGIGNNSNQLTPVKLNGLSGIVISNLVCGFSHTLALSDGGILYGWGLNGFGQLGTGDKGNLSSPTKICVGIGRYVIVQLLTSARNPRRLWITLFRPCRSMLSLACLTFLFIYRVIDIAATHYSQISAALTENFKVYMWGQCRGE